jgi:hypothetical protein
LRPAVPHHKVEPVVVATSVDVVLDDEIIGAEADGLVFALN